MARLERLADRWTAGTQPDERWQTFTRRELVSTCPCHSRAKVERDLRARPRAPASTVAATVAATTSVLTSLFRLCQRKRRPNRAAKEPSEHPRSICRSLPSPRELREAKAVHPSRREQRQAKADQAVIVVRIQDRPACCHRRPHQSRPCQPRRQALQSNRNQSQLGNQHPVTVQMWIQKYPRIARHECQSLSQASDED